jgi:O-antigen/teichoic acid export membrane protein
VSTKLNLFASYASQIYVGIVAIILIPVYIDLMGEEGYGLVGFFITLQSLFLVLDFGLSSTAIKQVTLYRGGALSLQEFRKILRGIEILFIAVALVIAITFALFSDFLTNNWFNFESLKGEDVYFSLLLIGILSALRWLYSFYRGIVNGYEEIVFLSWFGASIASIKYVVVIAALYFIKSSTIVFFTFQIFIALIEVFVIVLFAYKLLPHGNITWSLKNIREIKLVFKFAASVGGIGMLWVLISQYDKAILSGWMTLSDYGIYMMIVLGASVVTYLTGGMYNVLLPRVGVLKTQGKVGELKDLYTTYTEAILLIVAPIASMIFIFPDSILMLWTNKSYDQSIYDTFSYLALGNMFVPLMAFPYILQYAYSDFKVAIYNNIVVAILLPIGMRFGFENYGTLGVAINWCILMFISFSFSSYFVHKVMLKGCHFVWLYKTVIPIISTSFIVTYCAYYFVDSYITNLLEFVIFYCAVTCLTLMSSSILKVKLIDLIKSWRGV